MPRSEQIPTEQYSPGQRLRTYVYEVEKTNRGPRIKISRTHRKLLRRLLESEVPEIYNGVVEIKGIAREPGSRSKVAVAATQAGVDPVGSCVGMRGVRIQNIVNELNGEKTDIVAWAPEEADFVANALSPARVEHVWLDPDTRTATVVVPDGQLSLAIGKEGQNARLAAKLTGWRIDIKSMTESAGEAERRAKEAAERAVREAELAVKRAAAASLLAEAELSLAKEEEKATVVLEEPEPVAEVEIGLAAVGEVTAEEAEPAVTERAAEAVQEAAELALLEEEVLPEAVAVSVDAAAEVQEPVSEPVAAEAAAAWKSEDAEEDEEDAEEETADKSKRPKKGRRRRDLVYDEETGLVVSRKRRKESRRAPEWEEHVDY
jgi:N utilization substance protein A